jgi:hypothetical protein
VIALASELGVDWSDPVNSILRLCHEKIAGWLRTAPQIRSLDELQSMVCARLSLIFEEFQSDEELAQLIRKYVALGEKGFAGIKATFVDDVFATLAERHHRNHADEARYVAFIDLRGEKAARRYFTRWHEIAHLLTMVKQLELPFRHRSSGPRNPIEQLMDVIAGEVGFYEPLFRPAVEAAVTREGRLTFAIVDSIRACMCPQASFHATFIACSRFAPTPVVNLEVGMGLKKAEADLLRSGQMGMFGSTEPEMKLRALVAVSNEAAKKAGLRVNPNMQVPDGSLLARLFHEVDDQREAVGRESLLTWRHSDGTSTGRMDVVIEARRLRDKVIAIATPA